MSPANGRPDLLAGEDLLPDPYQTRSIGKRGRLKKAGLALFGRQGYEATSIHEIARAANVAAGGFYQHFRSKRQLLLVLMDDLLEHLSRLELRPAGGRDVKAGLREFLAVAFARDLEYLGAYRAWREAALSDAELARAEKAIRGWTEGRVLGLFLRLQHAPGARPDVDVEALARAMDSFFWNLLAQAVGMPKPDLDRWLDISTHLIYHGLFLDK